MNPNIYKSLFTTFFVVVSIAAVAQTNRAGTVHISAGFDGLIPFTSPTFKYNDGNTKVNDNSQGVGIGGSMGLKFSVGVSEKLSIGLLLRKEGSRYIANSNTGKISYTVHSNGVGFAPEVRIYLGGSEKFNAYFAPSVGFSRSNDRVQTTLSTAWIEGSSKGANYGLVFGANKYFNNIVGFYVEFGMQGLITSGQSNLAATAFKYSTVNTAISLAGGLSFRFGKTS